MIDIDLTNPFYIGISADAKNLAHDPNTLSVFCS